MVLSDIVHQAHQCLGVVVFGRVDVFVLEGFELHTVSLAFAYQTRAFHNEQTHGIGLRTGEANSHLE
jgi:hypothetical protein